MAGIQPKKTAQTSLTDAIRAAGIGIPADADLAQVWRASVDPLVMVSLAVGDKRFQNYRRKLGTLLNDAVQDLHAVVPSRVENAAAAARSAHQTTAKLLESVSVVDWLASLTEMREASIDWYETEAWATASILSMYCSILLVTFLKIDSGQRYRIVGELVAFFAARSVMYRLYLGDARLQVQNRKICDGVRALIQSPEFL